LVHREITEFREVLPVRGFGEPLSRKLRDVLRSHIRVGLIACDLAIDEKIGKEAEAERPADESRLTGVLAVRCGARLAQPADSRAGERPAARRT
jgi:hypothetical protein